MKNNQTPQKALINLQAKLITEKTKRIEELTKLTDGLVVVLKRLTATAEETAAPVSENGALVYAVYEVVPATAENAYIAVCLDNPFLYTVAASQAAAADALKEKVRAFYAGNRSAAPPDDALEGIEIPNTLPEDF
jgi:hypothetical protein